MVTILNSNMAGVYQNLINMNHQKIMEAQSEL